jgi:hypothetical protein
LYIYYGTAEKNRWNNKGEPDKFSGFLVVGLMVIPFQLMSLMSFFWNSLGKPTQDIFKSLSEIHLTETVKGPITGMLLLFCSVSMVLAHFICRHKIQYSEISNRLSKNIFFRRITGVRLFFLVVVTTLGPFCLGLLCSIG